LPVLVHKSGINLLTASATSAVTCVGCRQTARSKVPSHRSARVRGHFESELGNCRQSGPPILWCRCVRFWPLATTGQTLNPIRRYYSPSPKSDSRADTVRFPLPQAPHRLHRHRSPIIRAARDDTVRDWVLVTLLPRQDIDEMPSGSSARSGSGSVPPFVGRAVIASTMARCRVVQLAAEVRAGCLEGAFPQHRCPHWQLPSSSVW